MQVTHLSKILQLLGHQLHKIDQYIECYFVKSASFTNLQP